MEAEDGTIITISIVEVMAMNMIKRAAQVIEGDRGHDSGQDARRRNKRH